MLCEAEALLSQHEPSEGSKDTQAKTEQLAKVEELVTGAREQLEIAQLLGYGEKQDYEKFREQIAELEKKIGADQEAGGVFARLRQSLNDYPTSFFE
jgi:hypothetical protein